MKSICIKTNDTFILNYIEDKINEIDLDNIYFSCNEFKSFKNIIIHYKGKNADIFFNKVSKILSFSIIDVLEHQILKKIISYNYFYFDNLEIYKILNICEEAFFDSSIFNEKFSLLYEDFYNYIKLNKSIELTGFIKFRTKDYLEFLNSIVNDSVNSFIVEREYSEFISLLKMYIASQKATCDTVHLIFLENDFILLDEDKKIINIDDSIFRAKYLSDITFSSNDYILNTLLTLLPQKIFIHLSESSTEEFINTLQLIFEERIELCKDCSLCKLYSINKYLKE